MAKTNYERILFYMRNRDRNKRRKEMGDQNRKSILEMSTRAQMKRREWRTAQRNKRKRDRDLNKCLPETAPNSPPIQENVVRRAECMRRLGRKKKKRDRAKAYRTIEKLQVSLFNQRKLVNKQKKKYKRF